MAVQVFPFNFDNMRRQVKFNPEVQRAVFSKRRMTSRCLEHVPATSLVDEDEMASRRSEFQLANLAGKRALHEHHLLRKKCRLRMRQDIIDAFWTVYEQEAWNRLNEVAGNRDVTVKDVEAFALEAILSVNKKEIVKLWREKLMLMSPTVEQHEMVPFHDRWVQNQFKDQEHFEEMQRRLHTKANSSNDWLTELVNEMLVSPDTPPTPEFNNERVSEALTKLEFLHPEIFEDLQSFVEPNTEANKLNDSPDVPPTPEFNCYRISETSNKLDFVIPDVCEDRLTVSPKTPLDEVFEADEDMY